MDFIYLFILAMIINELFNLFIKINNFLSVQEFDIYI